MKGASNLYTLEDILILVNAFKSYDNCINDIIKSPATVVINFKLNLNLNQN